MKRYIYIAVFAALTWIWVIPSATSATQILLFQLRSSSLNSLVGIGNTGHGVPITVGTGLTLSNGTLAATPVSAVVRQYNIVLTRGLDGSYTVPTNARNNTVFYRNGLRQIAGEDYSYSAGVMKPALDAQFQSEDLVTCDGEL